MDLKQAARDERQMLMYMAAAAGSLATIYTVMSVLAAFGPAGIFGVIGMGIASPIVALSGVRQERKAGASESAYMAVFGAAGTLMAVLVLLIHFGVVGS